ncbi:MAG: UDP-glucose/GDP-mannose dehydrogenase family protein [bacterium]|nr:UDP-glucose/GDP-mannose dehydrogenase family protein [bacterium]
MKLAVIGTGYVGLVTGTCFAELGHSVTCVDIDKVKIGQLKKSIVPIYEPGLEELVKRNQDQGRLSFTSDSATAIRTAEVVFSAVGTPPDHNHRADLSAVQAVARTFAQTIDKYTVLVTKSTVPVGTNRDCEEIIRGELEKRGLDIGFDVVSNPEFLREGSAIHDSLYPDRVVIGSDSQRAKKLMEQVYAPWTSQNKNLLFFTSRPSAELIKYAANSFLATKISFINEIANFCELSGADIGEVAKGIGLDKRISPRFLHAGIGYGGSCFPKDVQALIQTGAELGYDFSILRAIEQRNQSQKTVLITKIEQALGPLKGKIVAIWGLAFKPKTDDIRCAPSLVIMEQLLKKGARIQCFDPAAMGNIEKLFGNKLSYSQNAYQAAEGADALLILTEWDEFRSLDFERLREVMKQPFLFDGRNIYDPEELRQQGFHYSGIGRPLELLDSGTLKPRSRKSSPKKLQSILTRV